MSSLIVVLDACVLYPMPLCDTLLRVAESGLYRLRLSQSILDEVTRNLVKKKGWTIQRASYFEQQLKQAFLEIMVKVDRKLVEEMTNHPKDRHVLATAVAAKANLIVTTNGKDFPESALSPYQIQARSPDDFLSELWDEGGLENALSRAIEQQAESLRNPPLSKEELLKKLSEQVPIFSGKVLVRWNDSIN